MLKARKANRVVKIPDDKKDAYLALGYRITDLDDNPIAEPYDAGKEALKLKEQVSTLEDKLKEAASKKVTTGATVGGSEVAKQASTAKQATK